MKPYYDADGVTIYCADMRDVDIPAADLVLTDPPYAEQTHAGARRQARIDGGRYEPQKLIGFESMTADELRACLDHIARSAQRWVISFMDWRHIYAFDEAPPAGLRFVRFGLWIKPNGAPQFTGDRPSTGWEGIAMLHRAGVAMRWNGGGHHAVYTCNIAHQDYRISKNPTAKPIPLVADLIRQFSDPGDLVVDPFMGSGSTIAAAKLLGRRAIGIERDEAACAALVRWLARPVSRMGKRALLAEAATLFDLESEAV